MKYPPDPRLYPVAIEARFAPLLERAEASLTASSRSQSDALDVATVETMVALLQSDDASTADLLAQAPSAEVARYFWRRLIDAWPIASAARGGDLAATFFALPVIVVAAIDAGAPATDVTARIGCIVDDTTALTTILAEHRALGENETFAVSPSLVAVESIDVPRLHALLEWQHDAVDQGVSLDLPPAPITLRIAQEGVHLRFLCGTAFAARPLALRADATAAGWGMPIAQALARQLTIPGASVLTLPRPPQLPVLALQQGRAAQREVALQLFASNAIRRLRASVGEPSAVISGHRCASAPGGGELRLSLSSPFEPKEAEGFRCPLFVGERVADICAMLVDLMRDCRVTDVRVVGGTHADRDPNTELPLLFKPETIPEPDSSVLH